MKQKTIKHSENYPEEYIAGKVIFFGREFAVTPDVLIPRLETECLVRRAREVLKWDKYDRVVDIGCGSGIIGTSVADLADEVVFLDISSEALRIAEKNFRKYYPEKNAQFIVSDLLDKLPLQRESREAGGDLFLDTKSSVTPWQLLYKGAPNTLLLANLPYIKGDDWENMSPDTRHEPELALFGGDETGFEMYERLFEQLSVLSLQSSDQNKIPLTPFIKGESNQQTNKPAFHLIIEFGFDQREIAEKILQSYGWNYEFFPDFAGIERFAEIIIR